MRRLFVLFGLILAGTAAVTWQAMGQAKLVEDDLAVRGPGHAPAVLGRDLPEVRVATPEVAVELPAS